MRLPPERLWTDALILPPAPTLYASLIGELAEYLGEPVELVAARCAGARDALAAAWRATAPTTPAAVHRFYQTTDLYLYDLTRWHSLPRSMPPDACRDSSSAAPPTGTAQSDSRDASDQRDSVLAQVEALTLAQAHFARTALDFGSGIGSLGILLARHGLDMTLAEVNSRLHDYARWRFERRGLTARFLDLRHTPLPHAAYDLITAVDVLEHVPDPGATLTALAEALRPGGVLLIHVPAEADRGYPMHLRHGAGFILRRLPQLGLWPEWLAGGTLVFRKGAGPRYALNPNLHLHPTGDAGVLLSTRPLLALKLNAHAYSILNTLSCHAEQNHHGQGASHQYESSDCHAAKSPQGERSEVAPDAHGTLRSTQGDSQRDFHLSEVTRPDQQTLRCAQSDTPGSGLTALEVAAQVPHLPLPSVLATLESFARRRLLTKHPAPLHTWPSVTVIIPAYGRPTETRACVESLLALDYPMDKLEIIVVDDGGPPLAPVLADLPVRVVRQEPNIGQSAGRNLAARLATGDVLACIDNDCQADAGWLAGLLPYLDDPTVGLVGGRIVAPPPTDAIAAYEAVRSPLDMGGQAGEVGPGEALAYLPACNLLVRRQTYLDLGGFDPAMRLGEDVDLVWRARQAGPGVRYAPQGQVIHHHRTHLLPFLKRRADYGSSEADLQRRHPAGRRVMRLPLVVIMLLVALVIAGGSSGWSAGLVGAALGAVGVETGRKWRSLRQMGVGLPVRQVGEAVGRAQGASLYHLGANVTRYYSLPLLTAAFVWPPLWTALLVLLLAQPLTDYARLRPRLALPVYIGLYGLEMLAYQVGVWRGCWEKRTLRPLLPHLKLSL